MAKLTPCGRRKAPSPASCLAERAKQHAGEDAWTALAWLIPSC